MEELLKYLNSLPAEERAPFAKRCNTTEGYIRKVCSTGGKLGEGICINVERESGRKVLCEQMRPDVDWHFIRNTAPVGQRPLFAQPAPAC
ncbi:MAG: YdaS family helix-turn-helix protein [Pseudomonadota bacterium]